MTESIPPPGDLTHVGRTLRDELLELTTAVFDLANDLNTVVRALHDHGVDVPEVTDGVAPTLRSIREALERLGDPDAPTGSIGLVEANRPEPPRPPRPPAEYTNQVIGTDNGPRTEENR